MHGRSTKQRRAALRRKPAAQIMWAGNLSCHAPGFRWGAVLETTTYPPMPERPTLADVFRCAYGATTRVQVFPRRRN